MFVASTDDRLIGNARTTVLKVQGMANRQFRVDVEQCNFTNDSTALKGEGSTRSDKATATDDRNFHGNYFWAVGFFKLGQVRGGEIQVSIQLSRCLAGSWGQQSNPEKAVPSILWDNR